MWVYDLGADKKRGRGYEREVGQEREEINEYKENEFGALVCMCT